MKEEKATVEVAEDPVVPEAPATEEVTRESLKEKGWSPKEMDAAEKRGMLKTPDEKKTEPKTKEEPLAKVPEKTAELQKKESSLPEFEFKTPEQEKAWLDAFGPGTPQRAMYFRMKNERLARQRAESERDKLALQIQLRKDEADRADAPQQEVDAEGNVIDPEDRPLTMKQLKALQKEEMDRIDVQKKDLQERSVKVASAMKEQEEYAKSTVPDFDATVTLAKDVVENLDQLEGWRRAKAIKLVKDLQVAAATADKYGVDDYTASMIAYELGQLHPKYGQKAEPNGTKADPKANGGLTPDQMKRMEENTHRRASSASLPASPAGRRTVAVEDLTIKDLLKMTPEERFRFKKDHPKRYAEFVRG